MTRKKQEAAQPKLLYAKSKVFETAVISTMSSGKSTLINSFIGKDLLPARHQVCTARTAAVLDNDFTQAVTGHILFSDGQYEQILNCDAGQISECLEDKSSGLADIIIECSIPGIRNIGQAILITDTPGVNNSADPIHAKITEAHIEGMSSGLIVYVLNAAPIVIMMPQVSELESIWGGDVGDVPGRFGNSGICGFRLERLPHLPQGTRNSPLHQYSVKGAVFISACIR